MKSINLSAVDLNLLVAFEAIWSQRSVTKAAEQLRIGQPAMSSALSRLRVLFEDELFVRLGRQMQPTIKAQTIAPEVLAALQQIRKAISQSQGFDPALSDRTFTIGSADYSSFVLTPPLLDICSQQAPTIDLQTIGFNKDHVGSLLEQGEIDIALGVFPQPPRKTKCEPLFEERFVGIVRRSHPALESGNISTATFAGLSHALSTQRRDKTGVIDAALRKQNLKRRVSFVTPHMMILPFIIASSDLVASLPSRIAHRLAAVCQLHIFELPIETEPWIISMLWSALSDRDEANLWLRHAVTAAAQQVNDYNS